MQHSANRPENHQHDKMTMHTLNFLRLIIVASEQYHSTFLCLLTRESELATLFSHLMCLSSKMFCLALDSLSCLSVEFRFHHMICVHRVLLLIPKISYKILTLWLLRQYGTQWYDGIWFAVGYFTRSMWHWL